MDDPGLGRDVIVTRIYLTVRFAMRGSAEGVVMSLLTHSVFLDYLVGFVGEFVGRITGVLLIPVFALVVWLFRRGEQFITNWCFRRYLRFMPIF